MAKSPKNLSTDAQEIYDGIIKEYEITDVAGLRILLSACQSWDLAQRARASIDTVGLVVKDRFGAVKPHPLISCERDARAAFMAGLKALDLDTNQEEKKRPGRPTEFERFKAKRGY
jgi:hypothetical protein